MKHIALALLLPSIAIAGALDKPGGIQSTSSLNAGAKRASPYSADQIGDMYEKNAIVADAKLKGQEIVLSGTVESVTATEVMVTGGRYRYASNIECQLMPAEIPKAAALKKGAHVTIGGIVTGKNGGYGPIVMINCRLSPK